MSSNAKLAYMLSICHELSDDIMTLMSKQYTKSKTVATRYYFTLNINFYELNEIDFAVKDVYTTFINSQDPILIEALQYHNDKVLTKDEMKLIYSQLIDKNIKLNAYQISTMYSIATVIKLYKNNGFKYIFIPTVINYGRDSDLLRQTGEWPS